MMRFLKYFVFFIFFFSLPISFIYSMDLTYPALEVRPLASQRLRIEAKREPSEKWLRLWTLEASSLTLLTAGILQQSHTDLSKDPNRYAALTAQIVGGASLAGTFLFALLYEPYQNGFTAINKIRPTTKKEKLIRERLAEEALQSPATIAHKLRWFSFGIHFATSVYLLSKAQGSTLSTPVDLVALVFSALPLVFSTHWEWVWNQQKMYKKKIYGPIARFSFLKVPSKNKFVPGMVLQFSWN